MSIYRQYLDIKETDYWKFIMSEIDRMLEKDMNGLLGAKNWDTVLRQQGRIEALKLVLGTFDIKTE